MGYDRSLMWGLLMLILIPVLMGFIGNTFGETIVKDQTPTGIMGSIASFTQTLANVDYASVPFIGGVLDVVIGGWFSLLTNIFLGYSMFPFWFNVIIIGIPAVLVIRSVISL